ncbi:hypothetical protein I545_6757 [Mycobacterium kansasii 662]|uniref:Uncharacterized protein n=2 Tax=Mycobacterium kansasii TaxID=1768 RepID=X7XX29_MYCKA|nr:hypothetical protein I545_6757 [Mycobacterium kansasii 662]
MLIAHAVEAAYQVKARLSTEELRRAMEERAVGKAASIGAQARAVRSSQHPRMSLDSSKRIPFFIFAYTTNISGEAAIKLIRDEFKDSPWHEQADGIFVLDGWAAVNIGNNDGAQRVSPLERRGFVLADELPSLVQMLWTHCRLRPPRWCTSRAVS